MSREIKDIKAMLYSYNFIVAEIDNKNQEILKLAEVVGAERDLKGIQYSDMPKGNGIVDDTYNKVEKLMDTYNRHITVIEKEIGKLFEKKSRIDVLVEPLVPLEREIIRLRYFKKYDWWMIGSSISYSRAQVFRIHDRAIINIEKILDVMI